MVFRHYCREAFILDNGLHDIITDDFRCDTNALESILSNVGITMPPPTSLAMDPSTKMKTVSFAASAAALSSCRLTSNFEGLT